MLCGASPAAPWEFVEMTRSIESRDAARMPAILGWGRLKASSKYIVAFGEAHDRAWVVDTGLFGMLPGVSWEASRGPLGGDF